MCFSTHEPRYKQPLPCSSASTNCDIIAWAKGAITPENIDIGATKIRQIRADQNVIIIISSLLLDARKQKVRKMKNDSNTFFIILVEVSIYLPSHSARELGARPMSKLDDRPDNPPIAAIVYTERHFLNPATPRVPPTPEAGHKHILAC